MSIRKFLANLLILLFFFYPKNSYAVELTSDNQFITIVNPVRISTYTKNIKDNFAAQYQETQKRSLPATWLLTYDVLEDPTVTIDLGKIDKSQELGIFLEITPKFTAKAGVEYNKTDSWHRATSLFLSGYQQKDRIKLIDTVFEKFKQVFGFYPKSVGSWWIDSYSLNYMQKKYNIIANLGLADQFATDGYQVWGQYWSTPFIPNIHHAGIPASSPDNKINLVTIEWAPRDPLNGYGTTPANNFSTQDYLSLKLTDDYFSSLLDLYCAKNLNQFSQITIGLETDLDPAVYHGFYARQLDIAKTKNVKFTTMADFANWYLNNYQITPPQTIISNDLLGSQKQAIWYQSPYYRILISYDGKTNESNVLDFRIYPGDFEEPNYLSPNKQLNLFINLPSIIDKASNPNYVWPVSKKKLTDITKQGDDLTLKFSDQNVKFSKDKISLHNLDPLPNYFKNTPLLKIEGWFSNITLIPQNKFVIAQDGLVFRGLSIDTSYFLKRPKIQLTIKIAVLLTLAGLVILFRLKFRKSIKLIITGTFFSVLVIGGSVLFYNHSQLYEVSQSETDALLHLASLPYGKVVVYDDGCLICKWQTKYAPPFFSNNRNYVSSISKKPIVYNLKIFKAKTRTEGREELKKLGAKYIYLAKFEDYQEVLPFSPGDYFVDMVYENANAQVWQIRDNASF